MAIGALPRVLAIARNIGRFGEKGTQAARMGNAARSAVGKGLRKAGTRIVESSGNTTQERLMTFAPDLVFGGLTALNTPGDLGDKAIAGGSDAILSSLGGIGLTAAIGPKRLGNWRIASDFVGGTAGSFAGMAVGDNLMRAKDSLAGGKGQTPFERLSEQEREIYEQNLLAQYGLGGYNLTQYDPFFQANGLG